MSATVRPAFGPTKIEFHFPATVEACRHVHTEVMNFISGSGAPPMEIDLSLEEGLANARLHGCNGDASKEIYCGVSRDAEKVCIVIRDPGPGFDPERVPNPLTDEGLTKSSGRGVHLIRSLMDEVTFARHGAEITMCKRFSQSSEI